MFGPRGAAGGAGGIEQIGQLSRSRRNVVAAEQVMDDGQYVGAGFQ